MHNSRMDNQGMVVLVEHSGLGTQFLTLPLTEKENIIEGRKLSRGTNAGSGSSNKWSP